ncbi:hypothetical protein Q7P37_008293 [Cladosporium fusiforme]
MFNVPDLQPIAAHAEQGAVLQRKIELRPALKHEFCTYDPSSCYVYKLDTRCRDLITRYLGQSLITPDDPDMAHVNRSLLSLALTNPHLMHTSIAVALAYDRHTNGNSNSRRTSQECYHWYQGTVLLGDRLKRTVDAKDKDAVWGSAAALAMLTVSSPDACSPEQAWPLKNSESSDLDWLDMLNGKMSLWSVFDPLRPDSIFRVLTTTYAQMHSPLPDRGTGGMSESLAKICCLDHFSTPETSPYFLAAHAVSQLLGIPSQEVTVGHIPTFTRIVNGPFESLLRQKDPTALLLLYLWYQKARSQIWWIELRARVECPAIRMYLSCNHTENTAIHALMSHGNLPGNWD